MVPACAFPPVLLSLRVRVFNTQTLAHILDSLVRVSRRVACNHFVRFTFALKQLSSTANAPWSTRRRHRGHAVSQGFAPTQTQPDSRDTQTASPSQRQTCPSNTSRKPFPFNDFRYFLTLFSKFFSSFARATCSLSVSRQYLAFDGVYHQL